MSQPWLDSYPEHAKQAPDLNQFSSLVDIFDYSVEKFADCDAYHNLGTRISYAELEQKTRALAAYLQGSGLQAGDRVAIMMPNLLQNPIAIFAVLRAGMVVVNTNPLYTPRELKHQLIDSGAKAIIIVDNFCHTLEQIVDLTGIETIITTGLGDLLSFPKSLLVNWVVKHVKKMVPAYHLPGAVRFKTALQQGANQPYKRIDCQPHHVAFLQYTGGTTGVAKGAVLTHANLVANMQQASLWISDLIEEREEIIITALPLYHIFSLTANCLVFMKFGAMNVLITNPRDLPNFIKELKQHRFTAITGVNTLFNALLNTDGIETVDFSHLKVSLGGGMAVQEAVAKRWKEVTKIPLIEAYGLTETSPAVSMNPARLDHYNGSIGLPIPLTEVSIRDEQGQEVPTGEPGELCVRGPQVMRGYWNRDSDTDAVLSKDGWLKTGDIATMNEQGYLFIVDRKKDMILVSGFNVYPNEVEGVLVAHPGILEAGVVGVADEQSGEKVRAVIVRSDPDLTAEDVIAYCRENLTAYKVPKIIDFVHELPKTNVGKILRKDLRNHQQAA